LIEGIALQMIDYVHSTQSMPWAVLGIFQGRQSFKWLARGLTNVSKT